jgi:3-methyladenine DNA glycosylase AlkD
MKVKDLKKELLGLKDPYKAKGCQRFFKTGKGEYGEGDVFLGITTPDLRKVIKKYFDLALIDLQKLLRSKIHESRSAALAILVHQYEKSKGEVEKKKIVDFYLKNSTKINNWDLVDISASHILGKHFLDKDKSILYQLARSKNLWERRMAIIATSEFIRKNHFEDTLKIAKILLKDKHDLIHKAVGWMLREVGKRDLMTEEEFLKKNFRKMPRTMLRYAIEKLPPEKRKFFLETR